MAALHDSLKSLGPIDFSETPLDDLNSFLSNAFSNAQILVESIPIPAPADDAASSDGRSRASSTASSASEISLSSARSTPPLPDIVSLQKEWKQVKLNVKDNPLGMNVYKLSAKDGQGSWFARRSVHEGLGFTKWKKALEREFPETMKVQGGPGEGNIRGIGGERRLAYKHVEGVGKIEVYLLSAQFPGPTTPRDFVTMFITSDQALSGQSGENQEVPRHFMVISRPCSHPDAAPRDGFIRGQYESVEFIREIPLKKPPKKSTSMIDLPSGGITSRNRSTSNLSREAILRNATRNHSPQLNENGVVTPEKEPQNDTRARGKTISFDSSRGHEAKGEGVDVPREEDECESNPVEWIMLTRSSPGGSVPRYLVERGTPGGIVSDASKFLNWACGKDIGDFESDDEDGNNGAEESTEGHPRHHNHDLHNYQTNGHLAGIEEASTPSSEYPEGLGIQAKPEVSDQPANGTGIYGMVADAAGYAGEFIASHTPQIISDHLPGHISEQKVANGNGSPRRDSVSSISSASSVGSFASALENYDDSVNDASSTKTSNSQANTKSIALRDKELQKLEDRKKKLDEKLNKAREKELNKKSEDTAKEEEAIRKAEEKHEREVKKQEERYKREVEKLQQKKEREEKKAEERKKKAADKDERMKLVRELEEVKAEVGVLRKEREILRGQVGDLQAENTALAARIGRLGPQGEEVLKDIRSEMGRTGRARASSLKGLTRSPTFRSNGSGEKEKENSTPVKV